MTDSLFWLTLVVALTALLWMPYILEFIGRVGLLAALSLADADEQKLNATPEWAERMKKAHYNAIENLVIFAPLVLIAHSAGTSVVLAAQVYFFARLLHFVFYTMGIGLLRTLAFFVGFFAQAYIALTLLGAL
jgi:uncharacterized MAPEG superfamily protein